MGIRPLSGASPGEFPRRALRDRLFQCKFGTRARRIIYISVWQTETVRRWCDRGDRPGGQMLRITEPRLTWSGKLKLELCVTVSDGQESLRIWPPRARNPPARRRKLRPSGPGGRLQRPLLRCNIAGVGAQLSVADENRVGSARALDSGKFPLAKSCRLPTSREWGGRFVTDALGPRPNRRSPLLRGLAHAAPALKSFKVSWASTQEFLLGGWPATVLAGGRPAGHGPLPVRTMPGFREDFSDRACASARVRGRPLQWTTAPGSAAILSEHAPRVRIN